MSNAEKYLKNYDNYSVTENGALAFKTSLSKLVDLNFATASLRNETDKDVADMFYKAYLENKEYAVKWMFFLRDIQEGNGERRSFRICLNTLAHVNPSMARAILPLVSVYGRWDDIFALVDSPLSKDVQQYVATQLKEDIQNAKDGKPISLLAKWMPSINSSSKETRKLALKLAHSLGMDNKTYRKTLSSLREHIGIIERHISAGEWDKIDYSTVPAKANLKYDNAFFEHDELRRLGYLKDVILNDEKANIQGIAPYELIHKLRRATTVKQTITPELLWSVMKEKGYGEDMGFKDAIVVTDVSGSMLCGVDPKSTVSALDVAESLSIYFSEQLKGVFKDKAITFSANPQFIDMSHAESLKEKLEILDDAEWGMNTNIEAVFDMLLDMAKSNNVPQEELPKQVVIISDMEFDAATSNNYGITVPQFSESRLFDVIGQKYQDAGYDLPKLIFWNVLSRTHSIPMIENDKGIALLSGFSQNAAKMVTKNPQEKDPYQILVAHLDSERYQPVTDALAVYKEKQEQIFREANEVVEELTQDQKVKVNILKDIDESMSGYIPEKETHAEQAR